MIKPNKVLGGNFYGYNLEKAYEKFIKAIIPSKPWAWIRNSSNGSDLSDRFDDLDSPVVTISGVNVQQATLSWQAIPKANGYRIDPLGVSSLDTTETLTGLTGGTQYNLTVVAVGDYTEGKSQVVVVRTKISAPGTLSSSNVAATQFQLNWGGVAGVTYRIEVSTTADFANPTVFTKTGTAGTNTFVVTGRTASTLYYYRVKGTKTDFPDSNYTTGNVTTTA